MGFQNLDGWNPGLRVVSEDAERVTVDNRPRHPHGLKLAEVVAPGQVATHRPVAEVFIVGRSGLGVLSQGLSHEAVTDRD